MDVIFDLTSQTATVVGAMSEALVVRAPAGRHMFGVRFRPGRASLFVDASAAEVRDARVPVDSLIAGSSLLVERVLECRSDDERVNVVAAYIHEPRSRARANDARIDHAVRALSSGRTPIARVASELGLSERQLERLFHERVGIRPKVFARVLRMQQAMRLLQSAPSSAIAAEAGYADEAHLFRDFRALCGTTPSGLAAPP